MEEIATGESVRQPSTKGRARWLTFLLRYMRSRSGAALALWRVEAYSATPLALLLIATLGRWPAALIMGTMMAAYSAVFLLLLQGDPILEEMRTWADRRRIGRLLEGLANRNDALGRTRRALALVPAVMILGPFWRAVAFHLFRLKRPLAYTLSVGGSFPHSLLWTGLVLGGIWESVVWPFIREL